MDRIQNEYLILFQQIMESNEGCRNLVNLREMRRLIDYRNAMNIWRQRLPHMCESITTWQEILENRNFIFKHLRESIHRLTRESQMSMQAATGNVNADTFDSYH